jgi:hypothetical protein
MTMLLAPVVLVLLIASFGARFFTRAPVVGVRMKPGESLAEAHTILLGTFRVYSWLVWFVMATVVVGVITGNRADALPVWYQVLLTIGSAALLVVAHALYWRLGYDRRRWLFVLGHLSGAFCLAEYFWALRRDMEAYLTEYEAKRQA